MRVTHTITHESASVHLEGETFTIKAGDPNFRAACDAIIRQDWEAVKRLVSKGLSLFVWLKDFTDWSYRDNTICYKGERLPTSLHRRMLDLEQRGQSPVNLAKFWALLQENPSWRSVQQTYDFLAHTDISIDDEGYILAYKGIKSDWFDCHTGKTHKNTVGAVIREPRNKISDDPTVACHFGLHAGDISYARGHARGRVVIVRIHPRDVVSIPKDESCRKMRCCEYTVVGVHNENQRPLDMNTTRAEDPTLARTTAKPPVPPKAAEPKAAKPKGEPKVRPPKATDGAEVWQSFNDLSDEALAEQNMQDLRKYACHVLNIVGSHKLRKFEQDGGKEVGLVAVCLAERRKNRGA